MWSLYVVSVGGEPFKVYINAVQAAMDAEDYHAQFGKPTSVTEIPWHKTDMTFPPPGVKYIGEGANGKELFADYRAVKGGGDVELVWK